MKKTTLLLLSMLMSLVASATVGDDFNYQNCTYLITKEYSGSGVLAEYGEITCMGLNATGKAAQSLDLTIPHLIARGSNPTRYYRVTKINDQAFQGCDNIVSVKITDKVNLIGSLAFALCPNLETVDCGAVEVGQQAFMSCEKLTKVTLQEGVQKLDKFCFQNIGIYSIKIPVSVTSIGRVPFIGCENLQEIKVNANNKYYASDNYELYTKGYNSLLYVPKKTPRRNYSYFYTHSRATIVESEAFTDYEGPAWVVLPYGIKTIKENAFANSGVEAVVIPATIESIETHAFRACKELNHLFINRKKSLQVYSIFTDAHMPHLYVPRGYEDVYLHNGWDNVRDRNAQGLESFDWISPHDIAVTVTSTEECKGVNGWTYEGRCMMVKPPKFAENPGADVRLPDCFYFGNKMFALTRIGQRVKSSYSETYNYLGGVNIDSIDSEAFINAKVGIVNLDNVSYIGDHAFDGCTNLTSYIFSQRLRYIGTSAFEGCKLNGNYYPDDSGVKYYMGHVFLPTNLETLGADAFYNTNVQTILVPSTVKNLSPDAFRGMRSVQEIFLNQHPTNWSKFRFTNVPSTCKLYVPVGETQSMRSEIGSAFKANNITSGAFDFAYENSEKVYINKLAEPATIISQTPFTKDGVQYDGKVKYVRCTNSTIPHYKKVWAYDCLENNGKKYLVTEIGDSCYTNFNYLNEVDLSEMKSLERIGHRAFCGTEIKTITIPESCTKFGTGAFFNAKKLEELIILGTDTHTWEGQYYGFNASNFKVYVHNQKLYSNYWDKDYSTWNKNDGSEPKDKLNIYVQPDYDNYNLGVYIPLDFASANVDAYVASEWESDNTLKMTKVDRVPEHTGVILANLTPGQIYKINRPTNTVPKMQSILSTSFSGNVDLNSIYGGGLYWDCATKKFRHPSYTSKPFYTGSGRSYLWLIEGYTQNEYFTSLWPGTPAGKKGDVNGDGVVDITDANILINIVLGKDSASKYNGRADVTGEGIIDVSDINAVLNIILGK